MTSEERPPPDEDDLSDPRHRDFDLSEWAPYGVGDRPPKPWYMRRWLLLTVGALVIISLVLPFLRP